MDESEKALVQEAIDAINKLSDDGKRWIVACLAAEGIDSMDEDDPLYDEYQQLYN